MGVTHKIRVHWGYYMQYAPYPWQHAGYTWDGRITVEKGAIRRCWLVDFSGYYGDVRETLVELDKPQWNWEPPTTQNRLGGIMFELDGDAQSRIRFSTKAIEFEFTVGELLDHGVIRKHLGQPYSNVDVTVIQDGFDPLLDQASELEAMTKADGRLRRLIHAHGHHGTGSSVVQSGLGMGSPWSLCRAYRRYSRSIGSSAGLDRLGFSDFFR